MPLFCKAFLPYIFVLLWDLDKKITLPTFCFVLCVICIRNRFTNFHKKSPGCGRNSLYCHLYQHCLYTKRDVLSRLINRPPGAAQRSSSTVAACQSAAITRGFRLVSLSRFVAFFSQIRLRRLRSYIRILRSIKSQKGYQGRKRHSALCSSPCFKDWSRRKSGGSMVL